MTPKFKKGDRVVAFGTSTSSQIMPAKMKGEITELDCFPDGGEMIYKVRLFERGTWTFAHEKQCRRLKPKRKPREWWIDPSNLKYLADPAPGINWEGHGYIRLLEVLKK